MLLLFSYLEEQIKKAKGNQKKNNFWWPWSQLGPDCLATRESIIAKPQRWNGCGNYHVRGAFRKGSYRCKLERKSFLFAAFDMFTTFLLPFNWLKYGSTYVLWLDNFGHVIRHLHKMTQLSAGTIPSNWMQILPNPAQDHHTMCKPNYAGKKGDTPGIMWIGIEECRTSIPASIWTGFSR